MQFLSSFLLISFEIYGIMDFFNFDAKYLTEKTKFYAAWLLSISTRYIHIFISFLTPEITKDIV